ncbi:S41 family peptidase [Clostridium estertheticum]|uniref:Tail specific protease domain-containing protein n=2 Tax=Clostridium estertheticum TaxID=238834 RepID=A0A1J0GFD7_9CLOT|nr:S41 family peptidase [Clostridium estertheticum]APC40090.1 hypothetical protein A7L45_08405 [Clostridium estertheticum subsp. estertheticum]MBU3072402.1 S41 family peptidase [Clostridium estertheticum]MBU3162495.1 S41 family peptidase [Clostridium estertheticum]MBU3170303.1 S41 family peptidase [Clostridium estertheticum]MBZ9618132.1 S41 family peptidase [Clostridium estertheticum subsp. laramiense]
MRKKKLKVLGRILGCVIALLGVVLIYVYNSYPICTYVPKPYNSAGNVVLDKKMTNLEVKMDVEKMIDIMENTHPIFLEKQTERYKEAKEKFLKETNKSMVVGEFQRAVSRYLVSIEDGHTQLYWKEDQYLNINWRYLNGNLVMFSDDGKQIDKVVTKINGVQINKVMDTIKDLFPAENYVAENINNAKYSKGKMVLTYSGVDCSKDILLTEKGKDGEENVKVEFNKVKDNDTDYEISSRKIDGKTIYVKLGVCEVNKDLNNVVEDLSQAVSNGIKNVIIDVRNNPGGNSKACDMLLDSLKMKPGRYGSIIRFSSLAQERHGFLRKSGYVSFKSSNDVVKNKDIKLYVITNEKTFSSAQMLATWVKDGKLGTIVGQPSSNMPSSFGDVLGFQLDNSKLQGQISFKKWIRPDKTKEAERVLEPDIYVDYSEDALSMILDKIK